MVTHLKNDEELFRNARQVLDAGHRSPLMRKKYRDLNGRLARLVEEFEGQEISLKDYIRRAAYALQDNVPEQAEDNPGP